MGGATSGFGDQELLRQLGWVRRLAAELVREPAAAEDLTQDVARVALEKRGAFHGDERGLRAWLATIARRIARDRHRSERARAARESSAVREQGAEPADAIVERSARARQVAELVHALPEPYRSTVLHRYFDEASVAEVARRMHADEATVRKRLQRARELLRTALRARGHGEERAWLALIAGLPSAEHTAAGPALGTTALMGGSTMTLKLLAGAAAGALVVALAAWSLRTDLGEGPHAPPAAEPEPTPLAAVPGVRSSVPEPVTGARALAVADPTSRAAEVAPSPGPRLVVRVRDTAGASITSGVLDLWHDRQPFHPFSTTRVHQALEIAGELTMITLPAGSRCTRVRASAGGLLPSSEAVLRELRPAEAREVELVVGEPLVEPAWTGRILVDGVQRVPLGLSIRVQSVNVVAGVGRVNRVDATWAVERVPAEDPLLVVTSDETVFARLTPGRGERASRQFDLALESGRTLILELLDRGSQLPLADAPFAVTTSVPIGGNVSDGTTRIARTDARGSARLRGLPREGFLSIGPDLDRAQRGLILRDGEVVPIEAPAERWHEQRLRASDPDPLTLALAIDLSRPGATAFGFVPPAFDAAVAAGVARVASAEITSARPQGGDAYEVPRDSQGRWTLATHWPSRHIVWVQDPHTGAQLSEKVEVVLSAAGEVGPFVLPPRGGWQVEVEVSGVPQGGVLSLSIHEQGGAARAETLTVGAGASRHRIVLARPAELVLRWRRARAADPEDRELTRRIAVDPAREPVVRLDLGGAAAVAVEFAPEGDALPRGLKLVFARWAGESGVPDTILATSTTAAGGLDDVPLAPGRWVWSCFAPRENIAVYGLVDVAPGAAGVRLAPRVERRPLAGLEHGIVWRELDGFTPGPDAERAWTVRFGEPGDAWIRADARWSAAGPR
ncbi:MAG: sigma-70 family RNA polymerase sigma factor [Planctomycetes bacterium]|nr:sigma-70 family RNA polymerase sigma factor [Planctomycetota bacterium]